MAQVDRRLFLTSAAGMIAGFTGCAGGGRKMTIELACGAVGVKATLSQAMDYAQRFGFESVGVGANELVKLSGEELAALPAKLEEKGLAWGAASMPGMFHGPEEEYADTRVRIPVIAGALRQAGVTRTRKWLMPGHDTLTYEENFRIHSERLSEMAGILGDYGITLGLEYVGPKTSRAKRQYEFVHNLKQTLELIADAGKDNVGIVADSWHWYTSEETGEDLLKLKSKDVVCADINDAPAGIAVDEQIDSKRDLPVATGVIDLKTFMNALNTIGFDGPVRAEPFKAELREMPAEEALAMTAAAMRKAFALIE